MHPQHESEIARRLLLAKDFFHRAGDYSGRTSAIDRIVAIHHFHVSIEITIKAILTQYEIRPSKELNIDFESMLTDVSQYSEFAKQGKRLKYRQQLRNLNQQRNLAQHHATAPESGALEYWRTICGRFLEDTFDRYFDVQFWELSRISYIQDNTLSKTLFCAKDLIARDELDKSVYPLGIAFELASWCLSDFLPDKRVPFPVSIRAKRGDWGDSRILSDIVENIYDRISVSDHFTGVIGSGISLHDLKKFQSIVPRPTFTRGGNPRFLVRGTRTTNSGEVTWAQDFVVNSILLWQDSGMEPKVADTIGDKVAEYLRDEFGYT